MKIFFLKMGVIREQMVTSIFIILKWFKNKNPKPRSVKQLRQFCCNPHFPLYLYIGHFHKFLFIPRPQPRAQKHQCTELFRRLQDRRNNVPSFTVILCQNYLIFFAIFSPLLHSELYLCFLFLCACQKMRSRMVMMRITLDPLMR